jgi:hypothetical protein
MHPSAVIAWGFDLGEYSMTGEGLDWEGSSINRMEFADVMLPALFGFAEPLPVCLPDADRDTRLGWWDKVRIPWQERLDAAVPVTIETYGTERSGSALILKRSRSEQDEEGCTAVNPATLAPPTPEETGAIAAALVLLGYTPARGLELLLMATYG